MKKESDSLKSTYYPLGSVRAESLQGSVQSAAEGQDVLTVRPTIWS